jgi:tetratricopeptide (TPR) repeat protein
MNYRLEGVFTFFSAVMFVIALGSCSDDSGDSFEKHVALFEQNKLEEALPLFKEHINNHPNDSRAYPWLAETYRRLGRKSEAVETAYKALELDTCNSFAHTVLAAAINRLPEQGEDDTTWIHINKALQCDSTNGNAWAYLYVEAMLRSKFDLMQLSARKLKETGFLTKAVMAYGKWMMRTLPENSIIITNGDMDTYPLLALQAADNYRTDVAVVEKEWLGLKQYLSYLEDKYGLNLPTKEKEIDILFESKPFPENMRLVSESVFSKWLEMSSEGSFSRPIALAVTVDENFYPNVKEKLQYTGPFLLYKSDAESDSIDILGIRNSIAGIRIEDFSGSWVSEMDYSPIRIIYTKRLAGNITHMALEYAEELLKTGNFNRAEVILKWAEKFENITELGPVNSGRISELRKKYYER